MNRSILSITILCGILLSACSSTAAPTPTLSLPPTATQILLPTDTPPVPTATPTLTATPLPPTDTPVPTPTTTEIPVFWDDFSGQFLPGWSWIRENDALWSLDTEPGFLRIVLTGDRPPRNLLVRDVTLPNFQIMTHVRFEPTSNYQFAGLLVYQDEQTMLAFGRAYCNTPNVCVGNGIYFDASQDGQPLANNFSTDTRIKDDAYLRLDKSGTRFTGYYSENGSDWMLIGEHEISVVDPQVGLITANSFIVGMTAYFDYFTVVELP